MKKLLTLLSLALCIPAFAQQDKAEVRGGNRKFGKNNYKEAEILYRKGLVQDSTSFAAAYDLASSLYMQKDYQGAQAALARIAEAAPESGHACEYAFNLGDVALQQKDWDGAVDAFRQALLLDPADMAAKENYTYAKLMREKERQEQQNQQNQDNDRKEQQKDQPDEQNRPEQQNQQNQQNQQQENRPQEQKISPQQAQQMLSAIQAKEKETQDKVEKKKALKMQNNRKEKNW